MPRRTLALAAACCALLLALGSVLLVEQARQRVEASVTHIMVEKGVVADPQTIRSVELYLTQAQLTQSLHTGAIPGRQNATMDATGTVTTSSVQYSSNAVLLLSSDYGWYPAPAALPVFAGLALLIGMLFTAAARWRPRERAAP